MKTVLRSGFAGFVLAFAFYLFSLDVRAAAPERGAVLQYAAASGENVWRAAQNPDRRKPLSRDLFTYGLALCEAGQHLERLDKLFTVAARMQDRDPKSKTYGNLRWSWEHPKVLDLNAVEFCMQSGTLIWIRHRDKLAAPAHEKLRELLTFAIQGCLLHRVKVDYTNIVLMNASNLILLGENLSDPAAAREGYDRLGRACDYILKNGIHEYDSPTYYGTDLDDLVLLEAFTKNEPARQQARALLELFWTDVALNWFPGAEKLAGARSRDYDYLRGRGKIENFLWFNGWIEGKMRGGIEAVYPALARWSPPARLRELSETRFPRLVRQSWGERPADFKTHYLMKNVTLSTAGAPYYGGKMDLPLTADFAGDKDDVRCYFIADGRHDPYGKNKIADRSGAHSKVFHLDPFFAAAQCKRDALGLVVYRDTDIPSQTQTLESHFVMPLQVDEIWAGARKVAFKAGEAQTVALLPGEAVVLKKGPAAVGVRVPWARGCDRKPAPAALVWDGNSYGAIRLTVDHQIKAGAAINKNTPKPAALFWVRIADDLKSGEDFARWRENFGAAEAKVDSGKKKEKIEFRVAGLDGPVAIGAAAPFKACTLMEPAPARVVLELDGVDVGRKILSKVQP